MAGSVAGHDVGFELMQPYGNNRGNSGVTRFAIAEAWIDVEFKDGWIYRYTNDSAGHLNVARMKQLAASGKGLAGFINQRVSTKSAKKFPPGEYVPG
jgi:hypothetical protein